MVWTAVVTVLGFLAASYLLEHENVEHDVTTLISARYPTTTDVARGLSEGYAEAHDEQIGVIPFLERPVVVVRGNWFEQRRVRSILQGLDHR